jgi:ferredoxin
MNNGMDEESKITISRVKHTECDGCGLCADICPKGAITEIIPVSIYELDTTIQELKDRLDDVITRIGKL